MELEDALLSSVALMVCLYLFIYGVVGSIFLEPG